MATPPSTKPYRVIAVAGGDEDDADEEYVASTATVDGVQKIIATAPLMIEDEGWQEVVLEGERRWASSSSTFKLIVVSIIFAISLFVLGSRQYHNKIYSVNNSGVNDLENNSNQEIIFDEANDEGNNDFFVPLTADEREDMKEFLRSTLRETKNALLYNAGARGNYRSLQQAPQRTLVLDSDLPKQFMHMHHMKTGTMYSVSCKNQILSVL